MTEMHLAPLLSRASGKPARRGRCRIAGVGRARRLDEEDVRVRSEEHTPELQSLMRISYAVFCLKKKTNKQKNTKSITYNTYKYIIPSNIEKVELFSQITKWSEKIS